MSTSPDPAEQAHAQSRHADHPRLDELGDAAVQAEFQTGRHEDTVEEAKQQLWRRAGRLVAGTLLTLLGLALLVLPGPGLVVLALGLALLAQDVPFARNLLVQIKKRLPDDGQGNVPTAYIAFMTISVITFTSLSIWWTFFR